MFKFISVLTASLVQTLWSEGLQLRVTLEAWVVTERLQLLLYGLLTHKYHLLLITLISSFFCTKLRKVDIFPPQQQGHWKLSQLIVNLYSWYPRIEELLILLSLLYIPANILYFPKKVFLIFFNPQF